MAICPFCGNEVEDFDVMCGKCGKTLTPSGPAANAAFSGNNHSSGGYNAYGGGYNPYGSSSSNAGANTYGGGGIQIEENGSYNPYGSAIEKKSSAEIAQDSGDAGDSKTGSGIKIEENGAYNPYVDENVSKNREKTYGSSEYNSPYGSSSGIIIEENGGYNPYGGSSAGGTSGGYNPYGTTTAAAPGASYNPYKDDTGGNSSGRPYLSVDKEEPIKYGTYNKALDTTQNGTKIKHQKAKNQITDFFKVIIVLGILAAVVWFGYPMIKDRFYQPYESIARKSVAVVLESDVDMFFEIMAYDYKKAYDELLGEYGAKMSDTLPYFTLSKSTKALQFKEEYGADYSIKTKVTSVKDISGNARDAVLQEAQDVFMDTFSTVTDKVTEPDKYFKREDVSKIKRIKVNVEIKGSKKKETKKYTVDIVKFDNQKGWKVMKIYILD